MRSGIFAGLSALLLVGATSSVFAAASCTDWLHLDAGPVDINLYDPRARQECVQDVRAQTWRAGYNSSITIDTLFFWFGDDVVTARCLSRTLVIFSSYQRSTRDACPLLNTIKFSLRRQG